MSKVAAATPMHPAEMHRYKLSDAARLSTTPDGGVVVKHLISERSYRLGSKESRVIHALQSGAAFEQMDGECIDPQFVSNVLHFLREKNILVARDHAITADYLLIEPSTPFWGQFATLEACKFADIAYVGVPYGYGNGASSAVEEAPAALRNWLRSNRLSRENILRERNISGYFPATLDERAKNLQSVHRQERVKDLGDLYIYPYENPTAVFGRLEKLAADMVRRGVVPVFIGGDHSITRPILKGLSSQIPEFCVLHFDAHNDCYQTAVDELFKRGANNHHGNFLSSALDECDAIRHAYQWGVRGINNLGAVLPSRVISRNAAELIDLLHTNELTGIPDDLPIYVTIDIDVLDPSVAPGTGSPIPGGITWEQLFLALDKLLRNRKVVGFDLVELDPGADVKGVTTQGAAHLLSLFPGFIEA